MSHFAFIGGKLLVHQNRQNSLKASTFDNGDGKPKSENPLFYKDLTDSIQVIS
jgi:hypothetical protein